MDTRSAGVFVNEMPSGVRTIVGVGTSTPAFLGYTEAPRADAGERQTSPLDAGERVVPQRFSQPLGHLAPLSAPPRNRSLMRGGCRAESGYPRVSLAYRYRVVPFSSPRCWRPTMISSGPALE